MSLNESHVEEAALEWFLLRQGGCCIKNYVLKIFQRIEVDLGMRFKMRSIPAVLSESSAKIGLGYRESQTTFPRGASVL